MNWKQNSFWCGHAVFLVQGRGWAHLFAFLWEHFLLSSVFPVCQSAISLKSWRGFLIDVDDTEEVLLLKILMTISQVNIRVGVQTQQCFD